MKLAICVGHLSTHVFESWKIYVFLMGGDETFGKWLKDGRVLCSVANKIQPGAAREGGRGMEEIMISPPGNWHIPTQSTFKSMIFSFPKWDNGSFPEG